LVAAQRAEQLMRGARPHLDPAQKKPTRLAQVELGKGLVQWDYGPHPEEEPPVAEAETAGSTEEVH
jgi:DNA-directed RNA polymerase subunit K/omega